MRQICKQFLLLAILLYYCCYLQLCFTNYSHNVYCLSTADEWFSVSISAWLQYLAILFTLHPLFSLIFIISLFSPDRYFKCLYIIIVIIEIIYTHSSFPAIFTAQERQEDDGKFVAEEMNKLHHYNTCWLAALQVFNVHLSPSLVSSVENLKPLLSLLLWKCSHIWESHCELFQGARTASNSSYRFQISHLMLWYSTYH